MLPTSALQISYQAFSDMVINHIENIESFQSENQFKFDLIVSKLRNGTVPGSIVASHMDLPMVTAYAPRMSDFSKYELLANKEHENLLKNHELNVLFVDSICGTGETIDNIKKFFKEHYPKARVVTYCTLVDRKSKVKPDISGFVSDKFFQPPWEWRAFTPKAHLDRLERENIKASDELAYYIGFSSLKAKEKLEYIYGKKIKGEWIEVFDLENFEARINTTSGLSSMNFKENLSLDDLKGRYNELTKSKVEYILKSGFTHFFEDNLNSALLISEKCPVTNIIYVENNNIFKISSNQVKIEKLVNLNF